MSANQQWYYTDSHGQQAGPVDLDQLKTLISQAAIPTTSMAWTDGMDDWKPIDQLPSLRSIPAPSPIATPEPTLNTPSQPQAQANSTATTAANPYAPPSAYPTNLDNQLQNPYENLEFGGIGRLQYFMRMLLLILAIFLIVIFSSGLGEPSLVVLLIAALLFIIFYIHTCAKRIENIGTSKWWLLLILVPIANNLLGIALISLPEGFAHHKKMDTTGIVLAVLFGILFLCSFLLNLATAFG